MMGRKARASTLLSGPPDLRYTAPVTLLRLLLSALGCSCALSLSACGTEVCPAQPTPAAFESVVDDLPSELSFCAPETLPRHDFPEPGDPWLSDVIFPNQAHVNFDLPTPLDAWVKVTDELESKGWEVTEQQIDQDFSVTFLKDGLIIDFVIINENQAESLVKSHTVHSFVVLRQAPCVDLGDKSGCADNHAVRCFGSYPAADIDCGAENKTCALTDDASLALCVSDLCALTKASSGKWDPDACPAALLDAD